MTDSRNRFSLQSVLALDALTCAAMGVLLSAVSGPVAGLTGLPDSLLFWAGLALLPVAMFIAIFSRVALVPGWALALIVVGNILWILASLALPVANLVVPNVFGWVFLVGQAAVVAVFVWAEWSFRPRAALSA